MMQQRGHPCEKCARLLHDLHRVGQAREQQRLAGGELEAQLGECGRRERRGGQRGRLEGAERAQVQRGRGGSERGERVERYKRRAVELEALADGVLKQLETLRVFNEVGGFVGGDVVRKKYNQGVVRLKNLTQSLIRSHFKSQTKTHHNARLPRGVR